MNSSSQDIYSEWRQGSENVNAQWEEDHMRRTSSSSVCCESIKEKHKNARSLSKEAQELSAQRLNSILGNPVQPFPSLENLK